MGKFIINGGAPLFGKVAVSGSKNSALPIIFATLIARGVSVIENIPDIGDARVATDIVRLFGASVIAEGNRTTVDTSEVEYTSVPATLLRQLRASTYLLGSSLVRFSKAEIQGFGGCNFSPRPIDMHLDAIRAFGGVIDGANIITKGLKCADITFAKRSVGATVNALLLAAGTEGESHISGVALEPHIMTLIDFLRSAGAEISLSGDSMTVRGGALHGGTVAIGGDMIEAGTYLTASLVTGGSVRVGGASSDELSSFIDALGHGGAEFVCRGGIMSVCGAMCRPVNICTAPYPGFPTDLQPVVAPLLSRSGGKIIDTVWKERFGYLEQLSRFGISSRRIGNCAEIFVSEPKPSTAVATDLRGGIALILAALAADGVSVIHSAETVLRGYERLVPKLTALGAEIEYCPE